MSFDPLKVENQSLPFSAVFTLPYFTGRNISILSSELGTLINSGAGGGSCQQQEAEGASMKSQQQ